MSKKDEAPDEGQQANETLEDALGAAFDEMSEAEESEDLEIVDEEVEVFEEGGEEGIEASDEGSEEVEVDPELVADADEVDLEYNEAAPERWNEDIRKAYNELPANMKEIMMEKIFKPMQRSYTEKTQSMANMRKQLDPMMGILNRHSSSFEKAGIDPIQALNRQMEWSAHFARVGNVQGAKDLAEAYGQGTGQDASSDAYLTPVEKRQQAQIDGMQQQLQTNADNDRQRQQQAQQNSVNARTQDVRNNIQSFASETRNGKPTHPHVERVAEQMSGLIRGGLVNRTDEYGQPVPYQQQLGQAYKMACEMDPSIRGAAATRSQQEQVRRASAANREVVSKTPGSDVKVEDTSRLSDSISDLYDRLDRSVA